MTYETPHVSPEKTLMRRTLGLAVAFAIAPGLAMAAEPSAVRVEGTRVRMTPPRGFVPAELFPGFQQVASGSSILVSEIPGPYSGLRSGMTKDGLASRGMTLLSSEPARLGGLDGALISVAQDAKGISFRKWLGLFGDEAETLMIVATFPASAAAALSDPLKRAVLTARWDREAKPKIFEGLTFRIDETADLKISRRIANALMLTKDGKPGPVTPSDPLLVVGTSHSAVRIDDIQAFARRRVMQTAQVKDLRNRSEGPMTIDRLPGYEIVASAKDADSGASIVVYQAIVVKDDVYYLVQGLVGAASSEKYVPEFRRVANSLSINR